MERFHSFCLCVVFFGSERALSHVHVRDSLRRFMTSPAAVASIETFQQEQERMKNEFLMYQKMQQEQFMVYQQEQFRKFQSQFSQMQLQPGSVPPQPVFMPAVNMKFNSSQLPDSVAPVHRRSSFDVAADSIPTLTARRNSKATIVVKQPSISDDEEEEEDEELDEHDIEELAAAGSSKRGVNAGNEQYSSPTETPSSSRRGSAPQLDIPQNLLHQRSGSLQLQVSPLHYRVSSPMSRSRIPSNDPSNGAISPQPLPGPGTSHASSIIVYCDSCGESSHFRRNSDRLRWFRTIPGWPLDSRCDVCGGQFKAELDPAGSSEDESKRSRKVLTCYICGVQYDRAERLLAHAFLHTGKKPFNCTLCAQHFTRKTTLRVHLKKHHGAKLTGLARERSTDNDEPHMDE
jgi:hypothetical protein